MTLDEAIALSKKKNPLQTLAPGDVGLGLQAQKNAGGKLNAQQLRRGVAGMSAQGDRAARAMAAKVGQETAPATDVLQKASNAFEAPFSLAGALGLDLSEGRGGTSFGQNQTSFEHALGLMKKGEFGKARDYSFTSWDTVRRLAKDGNPLAKWALQHPTYASGLMGASEFANPSNIVGGKAIGLLGGAAKAGLTGAGRAAGAAARVVWPSGAAAHPLYKLSQSLGEASTLARMGPVRQAATDEAMRRGTTRVAAKQAADKADVIGRQMATSTETATARAQPVVKQVFGGLSPAQKADLVDAIEGGLPLERITPDIAKRVSAYRTWRGAIDAETLRHGLAEEGELWNGERYFPRRGMTLDPNVEESEEQNALDEQIEARRSRGGQNIRRDTLNKNIPKRKYGTRQEAIAAGVKLNPEWDPAEALYRHAISRERNNILEEGAHQLEGLGLAEPLEGARKDYLPFTQLGSVRQFGSPLFRGSAVHPAVADLVEDLASQQTRGGLATAFDIPGAALGGVNSALARLQVSQPFYHIPVNVAPNTAMSFATHGADLPALLKAALNPKRAMVEAREAGASFPYADREFNVKDLEPWTDLTAKEKLGKAARIPPRAINALSTTALYKYMQPPIEAAAYAGLKGRMGPEAAALETRSIVGEPENLGAREKAVAQTMIFPSWQKSQFRRAMRMLGQNPALYQAPHTAVNARNESRGVSPDAYGWGSLIPPIVTNVSKKGAVTEYPIPGPFNRAIGLVDALGNLATGSGNASTVSRDLLNVLNPTLGFGARYLQTQAEPAHAPSSSTLYDKDAPAAEQRAQLLESIFGRYNPVRGGSLIGLSPETKLPEATSKKAHVWEQRVRGPYRKPWDPPSVEMIRNFAAKARKQGGSITLDGKRWTAAQLDKKADTLYDWMQKRLKAYNDAQAQ